MGINWGNEKVIGGVVAVAITGALGLGVGAVALAANAEQAPAATVETVEAVDYGALPYTNGLAGEQETDAAAAEAARIAEEQRVAAEQAAAAEAARQAAEQQAAAEAVADEQAAEAEATEPDPWAGKTPVPFIVDPNPENAAGGLYDVSQCPSGSASTGPDGVPYCD